ncbi:HAD domain-containing protein [Streptomyces sp. NPDC085466]|uniref:HAD domain-containing protein n=1 Tax=Streptomyces sp. NPDC085466 TaxID=3365725 RepID=UPI0037D54787
MTGSERLPLLFLDVDGPLIPFGDEPGRYPTFSTAAHALHGADVNPLLARIDPAHGPRLAALPCEVVWATTWMDDANEAVAPLLGLPALAVVAWPEPADADARDDARHGLHWKTRPLVARAAGRAFVWIDDELTDRDRAWVAAHHPGRALLLRVDARVGLTDADYAVCEAWLRRERDRPG